MNSLHANSRSHMLRTVLLLSLAPASLTVVATAYLFGIQGSEVWLLALAVASAAVALVPLILDIGRPADRRHILLAMISLGFTAHFVVPIFTHYLPEFAPYDPPGLPLSLLQNADIAQAQALALLGLLALFAGYALPIQRFVRSLLGPPQHDWTAPATLAAALFLITMGWMFFFGRHFGLIPQDLGSGFIGGFVESTIFGMALLVAARLRHQSRFALVLLAVLLPLTMALNFLTGIKELILAPLAVVVLTFIVYRRQLQLRWVALGVIALALLYPTAQFWRDVVLVKNTRGVSDVLARPGPALDRTWRFLLSTSPFSYFEEGIEATGRRLDAVGIAAVIIRDTPEVSPFQYGRTLALLPITYIPRAIWPDKPTITIGRWITKTYRYRGHEIPSSTGPSWIGEFYLNFGIPGIMLGMLGLGLLIRFAHASLFRSPMTVPMLIASVVVLYSVMVKVQGSVATLINRPIIALLPFVMIHVAFRLAGAARRVSRERDPEPYVAPSMVTTPGSSV